MKEIIVIGGGASGLLTSIVIKQNLGRFVHITIVERLERVGKKILATGSGKANFTNENILKTKYNQPKFVEKLIKKYSFKEIKELFERLGLLSTTLSEGRVYPKSENASSLLDVLRNKVRELEIDEKCNFEVRKVNFNQGKYIVESTKGIKLNADYVILATGGKASPVLGSNGSGYNIAKGLKMKVTDVLPGLVGIKVDEAQIKGLEGIRVKGKVSLFAKRKKEAIWTSNGEIQFKKGSVSGIVIMDMASQIARASINKQYTPSHFNIDFCPEFSTAELISHLTKRQKELIKYANANFLIGMFHKMLCSHILRKAKVDVAGYVKNLTSKEIERIAKCIKQFEITIKSLDDFERAQVSVGGICLDEVVPETLEARKNPGLYVCGEVLDVDGDCGGYNLQWAWTSALVVSDSITEKIQSLIN